MPNTLTQQKDPLFDFDDLIEPSEFNFDDIVLDSAQTEEPKNDMRSQLQQVAYDLGLAEPAVVPLGKFPYGTESPSDLWNAGMEGVDPPAPNVDRNGKELSVLDQFVRNIGRLTATMPPFMGGQAGATLVAGASALGGAMESQIGDSEKYNEGQSIGETASELTENTLHSIARIAPMLAYLPEALATDPGGTLKGFVEFIPDQAALIWKAVTPAGSIEEREEQKAAREQLYEDPLGPVFAGLMAGGIAKAGASVTKALRANAAKYRIARGYKKNLETAEKVAGETPVPEPELVDLSKAAELPPGVAGLLPDYSRQAVPVPPKPGPRSRLVPPGKGLEQDFGAVAKPIGEVELFLDVAPTRSLGTAPPGNIMSFLTTLRANAKQGVSALPEPSLTTKMGAIEAIGAADMVRLARLEPPRYRPLPKFSEPRYRGDIGELQYPGGIGQIVHDVNPLDVVPDVPIVQYDSMNWVKRTKERMGRVFDFIKQHENRVKAPESKALIEQFESMGRNQHKNLGGMAEDFRELGVLTQREGLVPALQRKLSGIEKMSMEEYMNVPGVRDLFIRIGEKFKAMGGQIVTPDGEVVPFNLNNEFLRTGPIRIKVDVMKKVWEDVGGITQAAETTASKFGQSRNAKYIQNIIDNMKTEKMSFSAETEKAISHLMGENPGRVSYTKTRGQAIRFLAEQSAENLFRRYGVERPRLAHYFPEEFIETNPARIVGRYVQEMSKAMAEIETFGPARTGLNEALKSIQKSAPYEYELMNDLSDVMMGVIDKTRPISKSLASTQRWYTNVTYGLKIGGGFAPVVQVSQPLISFMADAGAIRSARAAINVMKPTERAFLRRMGSIGDSSFRKIMGYGSGSRVFDYIPTTKFMGFANRMLDYWAAETGKIYAQDLYRLANKDTAKYSWRKGVGFEKQVNYARTKLKEDFGIDYTKPLGESEFVKMTQDYAHKSQLHPDALHEPKFMNMPSTRWMATLKRFAYKQVLNARDMTWKEWKRGNYMPTLRLAAGGYFGGGVMIEAKKKLREAMSGKHVFREQDTFWQDLANRYAVVGTFGMISDVTFLNEEDPSKLGQEMWKNVEFGLSPVAASDLGRGLRIGYKTLGNVWKNQFGSKNQKESIDSEEIGRQFAEDVTAFMGSFGYNVSGRLKSDESETKANEQVYSRQLKAARRAYWNDDLDRAKAIMNEWDMYAQDYPIDGKPKYMAWRLITDKNFKDDYER